MTTISVQALVKFCDNYLMLMSSKTTAQTDYKSMQTDPLNGLLLE